MKRFVFATLVVATVGTSLEATAQMKKKDAGTIIGGVIGGIIGNDVSGRGDKTEGTVIGVIVGAVIGNRIGHSMDKADRRALEDAQRRCLEGSLNQRTSWDGRRYGSRSGMRGEFVTLREGRHSRRGTVCREYESVIYTGATKEVTRGMACVDAQGRWSEVKTTEVTFGGGYGGGYNGGYDNSNLGDDYHGVPRSSGRDDRRDSRRDDRRQDDRYNGGAYSLSGYCSDYDHSQFMAAKQFAYSTDGLNLFSDEAANWAMEYNRTHRCGTINEYARRYKSLRQAAYSTDGLNMSAVDAKNWTLRRIESVDSRMAEEMAADLKAVYKFAWSTSGMNLTTQQSRDVAMAWVDRGYCESGYQIASIAAEYERQYKFAWSPSGMNMSSKDARRYAVRQLRSVTRCADILDVN